MNILDASKVSIGCSAFGTVSVRLENGQSWQDVAFVQLFPHSDPTQYVSMRQKRHAEAEYIEIGIIKDIGSLPEAEQGLAWEDIRRRYFLPIITEIVSIKTKSGADTWVVETDKGPTTFTVRERSENVTTSDKGVVLITDTDKCRYKIADIHALSLRSRLVLEKVLM
jgi:hypothetical protein